MNELIDMIRHDSFGDVQETLRFLLEECSLEELPAQEEVQQWHLILMQRGGKFVKLANVCQDFLEETA